MDASTPSMPVIGVSPIPSSAGSSVSQNHFMRLTGSNELCLVEIQGSIAKIEGEETLLGKLVQEENGKIYLLVGYQRLEGKVVQLKKPLAVLKRQNAESASQGDAATSTNLDLVDVCRKKIYFGTRPEPLGEILDGL